MSHTDKESRQTNPLVHRKTADVVNRLACALALQAVVTVVRLCSEIEHREATCHMTQPIYRRWSGGTRESQLEWGNIGGTHDQPSVVLVLTQADDTVGEIDSQYHESPATLY